MPSKKKYYPHIGPVLIEPHRGITRYSLDFLEKHSYRIGPVHAVVVFHNPQKVWYWTQIVGEQGEIWVSGFSLGYGGEGPSGLDTALRSLGFSVPEETIFGRAADIEDEDLSRTLIFTHNSVTILPDLGDPERVV